LPLDCSGEGALDCDSGLGALNGISDCVRPAVLPLDCSGEGTLDCDSGLGALNGKPSGDAGLEELLDFSFVEGFGVPGDGAFNGLGALETPVVLVILLEPDMIRFFLKLFRVVSVNNEILATTPNIIFFEFVSCSELNNRVHALISLLLNNHFSISHHNSS
jgi:hypothetical protein